MSRKQAFTLLLLGAVMVCGGAFWIRTPGYMDADYYFAIGQQLAAGHGFQEPFIWTYITNPAAIQHPAHLYWMPLTSLVAAVSMKIFGVSYRAAQLPFLILTALLPLAVSRLSLQLFGDARQAYRAGWYAGFSGFFFPYFLTTDMFILFAWIGLGIFYVFETAREASKKLVWWPVLGALVGLGHLARADGWLLFVPLLVGIFRTPGERWKRALLVFSGYLLIMGPWFIRNISVTGSPLGSGVGLTLWLTSYAQFFHYPPQDISAVHWLEAGFTQALIERLKAFGVILERVLAENGLIFLAPFMVLGGIRARSKMSVRLAGLYGLLLIAVMSFVFPFAGVNGGIFHSSAALMPVLWCLAPFGLDRAIEWGASKRSWDPARARHLFHPSAIIITAILTICLAAVRVVGNDPAKPRWGWPQASYLSVGDYLSGLDADQEPVAVNNPPGYWVATGTQGIVVPTGGLVPLRKAMERYQVKWLILDVNRPDELHDLYNGVDIPNWLVYSGQVTAADGSAIRIFRFSPGDDS
ncbi:MAG: ArnT family glycosyltransferase [Anaerolineales bacterium]